MNLLKRQATRRAKRIARAKYQHAAKVGTAHNGATFSPERSCGPGFPKDVTKMGNDGKRKNPMPGPGKRLQT